MTIFVSSNQTVSQFLFLVSISLSGLLDQLYQPCFLPRKSMYTLLSWIKHSSKEGLPWWLRQWGICLHWRWLRFIPGVRKIPWRRNWQPTPVFWPGESQGQRSLAGYNPWSPKESDVTERLAPCSMKNIFELIIRYWYGSGLLWWLSNKESACQGMRLGLHLRVRKIPWRRNWQPTPVFLPGKSPEQRSLVGYSPWGHRVSEDETSQVDLWAESSKEREE